MSKTKKETDKSTTSGVLARTLRKDFEKETGKRLLFTPMVSNTDLYVYWLEREYDKLESEVKHTKIHIVDNMVTLTLKKRI